MAAIEIIKSPNPDVSGVILSATNSAVPYQVKTEDQTFSSTKSILTFRLVGTMSAGDMFSINGVSYMASDDPGFGEFASSAIATTDQIGDSIVQILNADPNMDKYHIEFDTSVNEVTITSLLDGSIFTITATYSPISSPSGPFFQIVTFDGQNSSKGMGYIDYTVWVNVYTSRDFQFGDISTPGLGLANRYKMLLDKPFVAKNEHNFDVSGVVGNELSFSPPQLGTGIIEDSTDLIAYWLEYGEAFTPTGLTNKQRYKVGSTNIRWGINAAAHPHAPNDMLCYMGEIGTNIFVDGPNNGDMEQAITGLTPSSFFVGSQDLVFFQSGLASYKLTPAPNPPPSDDIAFYHDTTLYIEADVEYRIEAWISIDPGVCGMGADIVAEWKVNSGFAGSVLTTVTSGGPTATWIKVESKIFTAIGGESGTFQLFLSGADVNCIAAIWVDNIRVQALSRLPRKFLTAQPACRIVQIPEISWLYFLWHDTNPTVIGPKYVGVRVILTFINGDRVVLPLKYVAQMIPGMQGFRIDPDSINFNSEEFAQGELISFYEVWVVESTDPAMKGATRITEVKKYILDRKCPTGEVYNFAWKEAAGGYVGFSFIGDTEASPVRKATLLTRTVSPFNYSPSRFTKAIQGLEYEILRKSTSGFIDKVTFEWLRDGLLASPVVFVYMEPNESCPDLEPDLYSIIIESFEAKNNEKEGIHSIDISWRFSINKNTIRG